MALRNHLATVLSLLFLTHSIVRAELQTSAKATKNEVIVMGMIHSGHRKPGPYDLGHLKSLIRRIQPDYVLTEIPPDRLEQAAKQFRETGKISESRVRVFPEYTDVLFPLTAEMPFEIIPCAAWTKAMNDSRRATLTRLKKTHATQYKEMTTAQNLAAARTARLGNPDDPVIIHTDQYDAHVKTGMGPYNRHFNDLIGDGGWENINAAHYAYIDQALNAHTGEGKRFLITFGSWHKYYIKAQLAKRSDIKVIPMSSYLIEEYPTPDAWPSFRANANQTSSYGATEISRPVEKWKFETGEIIESSCAVVGDSVFVGGHAKRIHAIDRKTGKLLWKFDAGGWVRASPSVVDDVVYFGADDNKFYALDAKTGKKRWDFALGEGGEQSSPAIVDGVVYFGAFDNYVYALDAATGKPIWKFDAKASMLSSPAVTADAVYIATYGGKVFAVDRATGKSRWSFHESDEAIFSSPVVDDKHVYFGSYDHHIYAVNVDDGSIQWKYKTAGQVFSSAAIADGTLYIGSNDGHLYALTTASGAIAWKSNLGGAVFSSPAVSTNSIYVGSSDGHLYSLNRKDGSQRWAYLVEKDAKVWTSPAAVQGTLYFGSHAGNVIALQDQAEE